MILLSAFSHRSISVSPSSSMNVSKLFSTIASQSECAKELSSIILVNHKVRFIYIAKHKLYYRENAYCHAYAVQLHSAIVFYMFKSPAARMRDRQNIVK